MVLAREQRKTRIINSTVVLTYPHHLGHLGRESGGWSEEKLAFRRGAFSVCVCVVMKRDVRYVVTTVLTMLTLCIFDLQESSGSKVSKS